jgi:hypothetical protein
MPYGDPNGAGLHGGIILLYGSLSRAIAASPDHLIRQEEEGRGCGCASLASGATKSPMARVTRSPMPKGFRRISLWSAAFLDHLEGLRRHLGHIPSAHLLEDWPQLRGMSLREMSEQHRPIGHLGHRQPAVKAAWFLLCSRCLASLGR